jgi:hypothetical protein
VLLKLGANLAIGLRRVLDTILKNFRAAPGSAIDFGLVFRNSVRGGQELLNCVEVCLFMKFRMGYEWDVLLW